MLLDMGIPDLPTGVNETNGMCQGHRNSYQKHKAPAYSISKGAMITVATSEVWLKRLNLKIFNTKRNKFLFLDFHKQFSSRFFHHRCFEVATTFLKSSCIFYIHIGKRRVSRVFCRIRNLSCVSRLRRKAFGW